MTTHPHQNPRRPTLTKGAIAGLELALSRLQLDPRKYNNQTLRETREAREFLEKYKKWRARETQPVRTI